MDDSLVCLCKYDNVIFAKLLMQIWRTKAWTHMPVLNELLCIYNDVMFAMFYVICLCAVCGTNFEAPSVHMACKDKPK